MTRGSAHPWKKSWNVPVPCRPLAPHPGSGGRRAPSPRCMGTLARGRFRAKKEPGTFIAEDAGQIPGGDLLSQDLSSQYHRRCSVSLPGSEWDRVVPPRSGHQRTTLFNQGRVSGCLSRFGTSECCSVVSWRFQGPAGFQSSGDDRQPPIPIARSLTSTRRIHLFNLNSSHEPIAVT